MEKIEIKNLSRIFEKSLYRIPDYQRGYAWQKRQLIDFWEDLQNIRNGRKHYTGQLTIKKIEDPSIMEDTDGWMFEKKSFEVYDVLDGQQRLTTIIILIQQIVDFVKRNYTPKDGDYWISEGISIEEVTEEFLFYPQKKQLFSVYYFDYYKANPSYNFFHKEIYGDDSIGSVSESFYTHNLLNARNFFNHNLEILYKKEGKKGIEELFDKVTKSLQFIIYDIGKEYDVFVAFETMNNRGKPLSNLEILKNRLIFLTTLFSDDVLSEVGKQELRSSINEAWKEIYQNLGRNKDNVLSDDEFLRAHWIMFFGYSSQKGKTYIDYLLNSKFVVSNINKNELLDASNIEDVKEISDEISDTEDFENETNLENVPTSHKSQLTPKDIKEYVVNLKKSSSMWFLSFNPWSTDNEYQFLTKNEKIWLERLNILGVGYFRPLIMSALMLRYEKKETDITDLLKAIERWIFIAFHLSAQRSHTKRNYYFALTQKIYRREKSIEDAIETLKIHTEELFDHEGHYKFENFYDTLERLFRTNHGFYSWRDIHYFLFEYEASIYEKEKEKKLHWGDFSKVEKEKVTIEHILPQTATTQSDWSAVIDGKSAEEIHYLTHSIGNLLALSISKNSKFSNDSFADKKNGRKKQGGNEYLYNGYSHGSHSEIEVSKYEKWTSEEIYLRGERLIDFLSNRWGLNLSIEQKNKLLFKWPNH